MISEIQKHLLNLLRDGKFHSGTELAQQLGISRSAICKQLQNLTSIGVEITAISGKGYRLQRPIELLSHDKINHGLSLRSQQLIHRLEIHDQIDSTNRALQQLASLPEYSGTIYLAEYQTAGKGRRGRHWVSPFGTNIYLSLLWHYLNSPAELAGLSLAIGVAIIRSLRTFGFEETGLKWPNDIYWHGRKLGGILIEVTGETEGPCQAIIGLGLNAYLPAAAGHSIDQPWVDLDSIAGYPTHAIRNRLVTEIIEQVLSVASDFDTKGLSPYVAEWRQYDCMAGRFGKIYWGNYVMSGTLAGINDQGLLIMQDENGHQHTFASGEVSFHRSNHQP